MPSKPNILIVGQSGSGKSSSLEQLFRAYPKDVAFIDFERKSMPFLYDPKSLGFFAEIGNYNDAQLTLTALKQSKCNIVVFESFTKYCEYIRDYCKQKYTGWDIWNGYNAAVRNFLEFCKSLERLVIMTASDEVVYVEQAEGSRVSRLRCFVQGKEYEGKIEKEFLCVLFCYAKKGADGKIHHYYAPHTDGITSAKTPQWLNLPDSMSNDVSVVVQKLVEAKVI